LIYAQLRRFQSMYSALKTTTTIFAALLLTRPVLGQDVPQENPDAIRFRLPPITVTAEKVPDNVQDVPASVTAVPKETLQSDDVRSVSGAGVYAPNTFFTEFSARKLSNARFRGIGSSPNNPAITTYIDGVPQLSANSSNIELIDVDQIEFVRGPQSALYGRNTLGGLINVTSSRPSRTTWTGNVTSFGGDFHQGDVRANISRPLPADQLA